MSRASFAMRDAQTSEPERAVPSLGHRAVGTTAPRAAARVLANGGARTSPRMKIPANSRSRLAARSAPALAALVLVAAATVGCEREEPPAPPPAAEAPQRLPTTTIRVGDVPLVVEVADTEAERQTGMMFRRRLGPDEAMLFIFPGEANRAFHMTNCYVDLDLAYIAADGTILEIVRLHAHARELVHSREPARFALETPAGWLADHGIAEGDRVTIPPEIRRAPPRP